MASKRSHYPGVDRGGHVQPHHNSGQWIRGGDDGVYAIGSRRGVDYGHDGTGNDQPGRSHLHSDGGASNGHGLHAGAIRRVGRVG